MGHQNSYVCLVYISCSDQSKLQEMYYINHIGSFSIHSNVCVQRSSKRTCSGLTQFCHSNIYKNNMPQVVKLESNNYFLDGILLKFSSLESNRNEINNLKRK